MKWIKASERLPDKKGKYKTRSDSERVYFERFFHNDGMPFMSQPEDMEWYDEPPSPTSPKEEADLWYKVINLVQVETGSMLNNSIVSELKSKYTIRKKDFQPVGRNEGGVKIKSVSPNENEEMKKMMDESVSHLSEEDKKRVEDYFVPSDSNSDLDSVASHTSGFGDSIDLSKITDEDCLVIAKMFRANYDWVITERNAFAVVLECDDYTTWIWFDGYDFISFEEKYKGKENIEAHGGERETTSAGMEIIDMIDYLRSKGYNLPNKFATPQPHLLGEKKLFCSNIHVYGEAQGKIIRRWLNSPPIP